MKRKVSGPKNKFFKKPKLNLSSFFTGKPIIKNGYVMALLVFIGLVVAFNIADNYDVYSKDEVTGMPVNIMDSLNRAFEPLFGSTGIVATVFNLFTGDKSVNVVRVMLAIVLYLILIYALRGWDFEPKYKKIIVGLIAIISVIYTPEPLIIRIFSKYGTISGIVTLVVVGIFAILPLYLLFKWGAKDKTSRFEHFLIAVLFFIMFIAMGYFEQTLFTFTSVDAIIPTQIIREYVFLFGIFASIIGCGWALIKGFSGWGPTVKEAAVEAGKAVGVGAEAAGRSYGAASGRTKQKRGEEVKKRREEEENRKKALEVAETKKIKENRDLLKALFGSYKSNTNEKDRAWLKALGYVNRRFGDINNIRNRCKMNNDEILRYARRYGGIKK